MAAFWVAAFQRDGLRTMKTRLPSEARDKGAASQPYRGKKKKLNIEDMMKELTAFKLNSSDPEAKLHVALNYDELELLATSVSIANEHLVQRLPFLGDEMLSLSEDLMKMYDHLSSLIDTYFE